MADEGSITFDALVMVLGSVRDFETVEALTEGDLASFFFSESGCCCVFTICLELFRGVMTAESIDFSFLDADESFLPGECVERVRPLEGEGVVVSSTDLYYKIYV